MRTGIFFIIIVLAVLFANTSVFASEEETLVEAWKTFNNGKIKLSETVFEKLKRSSDKKISSEARLGLGYIYHKTKRFLKAKKVFLILVNSQFKKKKTLPALLNALIELKELKEAEGFLVNLDSKNRVIFAGRVYHNLMILLKERPDERYRTALKLLEIDEDDNFALSVAAWHLYNNKKYKDSLKYLKKLFRLNQNEETAKSILKAYEKAGLGSYGFNFAKELSESSNTKLNNIAASFYESKGSPLLASQTVNYPNAYYSNAFAFRSEGALYHRYKSGDEGRSKINETLLSVSATGTVGKGKQLTFHFKTAYLNSGDAESKAGSYYRYLNGDKPLSKLDNEITAGVFLVKFESEERRYSIFFGSSPLNADVDPTPVFHVKTTLSGISIDLHRESVRDSILSYSGLNDPYGGDSWGRVIKNGISLKKDFSFNKWWISSKGEIDHYCGENVWDNTGWKINLAVGKTYTIKENWKITFGGFSTFMHFDRNSNHFTYGHGGYYSPESMFVAGPLFRVKNGLKKRYIFDLQLSLGWMNEKTEKSPYYPLSDSPETTLNSSASDDFYGVYEGDTNSGITFSMKCEGWKMFTDSLSGGVFLHIGSSTDHNEWKAGFAVEYSFKPWKGFWKHKDIDTRF